VFQGLAVFRRGGGGDPKRKKTQSPTNLLQDPDILARNARGLDGVAYRIQKEIVGEESKRKR
jgi:hypothetical protein